MLFATFTILDSFAAGLEVLINPCDIFGNLTKRNFCVIFDEKKREEKSSRFALNELFIELFDLLIRLFEMFRYIISNIL